MFFRDGEDLPMSFRGLPAPPVDSRSSRVVPSNGRRDCVLVKSTFTLPSLQAPHTVGPSAPNSRCREGLSLLGIEGRWQTGFLGVVSAEWLCPCPRSSLHSVVGGRELSSAPARRREPRAQGWGGTHWGSALGWRCCSRGRGSTRAGAGVLLRRAEGTLAGRRAGGEQLPAMAGLRKDLSLGDTVEAELTQSASGSHHLALGGPPSQPGLLVCPPAHPAPAHLQSSEDSRSRPGGCRPLLHPSATSCGCRPVVHSI